METTNKNVGGGIRKKKKKNMGRVPHNNVLEGPPQQCVGGSHGKICEGGSAKITGCLVFENLAHSNIALKSLPPPPGGGGGSPWIFVYGCAT